MKHSFVKAVVNSLNQSYKDYVKDVCNNNLTEAVTTTMIEMIKDGRDKKLYGDFDTLRKALVYLDKNGFFEE